MTADRADSNAAAGSRERDEYAPAVGIPTDSVAAGRERVESEFEDAFFRGDESALRASGSAAAARTFPIAFASHHLCRTSSYRAPAFAASGGDFGSAADRIP